MLAFAAACWLLVTGKPRTHPSFQFGLMLIAAAAISGVMLLRGRTGDRFFRSAEAKFSTTLRQGSLRIWLLGLVLASAGAGLVPEPAAGERGHDGDRARRDGSGRFRGEGGRPAPRRGRTVIAGFFLPVPQVRNRTGQ
ncbi:hypothetical protein G3I59_42345 [Amycolatopsis rubida]|uniref:Uncharacterized protein n=1 Tax=Amycolatopsis rubida TaxID=112413 RepID=A0ABX0CAT0_9PSEU|nr:MULTISPECIES: hypothetical protein [Amycolatopsis]MYW97083.1 hypothetical protein [Amycolatopsis rubida]NEC62068.1 hypothetical protein [Amycolatopsis rubida]